MDRPISPPPVLGGGRAELPAYLSNGIIGLRVRDNPLVAGMALLNGFSGEHAVRRIEAAALAPYPVAGDIGIDGVWMSDAADAVRIIDQAYDFETGELTSRFVFSVGEREARVEVLSFCSRSHPTLVCQDIAVEVDAACDLRLRAQIDISGIEGRALRHSRTTPGEAEPASDGVLLWESAGGLSTCGLAYVTELLGETQVPERPALDGASLTSEYGFRAHARRKYRLRQIVSLIPNVMHQQPDYQAARLVAFAANVGFEAIRAANRDCWRELWKGRIKLVGAEPRWQAMADAAFFYLMTSTHPSSPSSTSIFGLATWRDYHYYFGHVMWDIETFCVPPLVFLQPEAARTILDYRVRSLGAAQGNARMMGRRGIQFPWESAPHSGEESAPIPGSAAWREDHATLDIARAFALFADATGDLAFLSEKAWPILAGTAEWIKSRVTKSDRGYEIRASMGIAERKSPSDNAVFTNLSAQVVLGDVISAAKRLGKPVDPLWAKIADEMVVPVRDKVVISHDGFRVDEEKAATPDSLMGVFPLGARLGKASEQATLEFYLGLAGDYIGSPMLSALYGVWAARTGDRTLSLKMLEDGYAKFCVGRFMQILEYRTDVFPEQPRAGPFFANMGGFLTGLVLGFPRLQPLASAPEQWGSGPIVLPEGWQAIEIEQIWIRGAPWRLRAAHGADRAVLEPAD